MAETIYNAAKAGWLTGAIDLENDTIQAALLTGAVTIDPDHATVAAVIAANTEASDGTYARVALGSKAVTQNDTDDRGDFDSADIDFTTLDNTTPTAILIFKFVTNDAGSTPISIHDTGFGSPANGAGYVVATPNDVLRLA